MLLPAVNELHGIIRRAVQECGVIPFARFMELSLYCPEFGYYERFTNTPGRRGDFYTSVSVGRLFGELLAFQFSEWLGELGAGIAKRGMPDHFQIVEAGAHDGHLAADILDWLRSHRPAQFEKIEYWIVEPSLRRSQWQQKTLGRFAARLRWFESWEKTPRQGVRGIIFSNELLDSMPVHRVGWDAEARRWFEWGVSWDGEKFVLRRMSLERGIRARSTKHKRPNSRAVFHVSHLKQLPADLLAVLPDGFTTEVCPAATEWWRQAAHSLKQGWLLTFDYGLAAEQFLTPERAHGTLYAYHRHRPADDPLANAGDQDLTAQVNFTAIQAAGESAGLKTAGLPSQADFLTRVAFATRGGQAAFGEWTTSRVRQFQTLTHPDHLGRAFNVLIQTR